MLFISTAETLSHVMNAGCDPGLRQILERYSEHLDEDPIAELFILQRGDSRSNLARCRGRPFELWEFILEQGGWFEAAFVLSDDGFGHIVLIPDTSGVDQNLLSLCRDNAIRDN